MQQFYKLEQLEANETLKPIFGTFSNARSLKIPSSRDIIDNFVDFDEEDDENKEKEEEGGGGRGEGTTREIATELMFIPSLPRKTQSSALKNAIYRNKVSQHKFKAPQKSKDELLNDNVEIPAGPEFMKLNADEGRIAVKGGDGTVPRISDFKHFVEPLQNNLARKQFELPTLIQRTVIPIIEKKKGYDLIARAQTGTGKTGSFLFPIIHLLERLKKKTGAESPLYEPNAIIVAPTRELTQQLGDVANAFSRGTSLKVVCSYGEIRVSDSLAEMRNGFDIFVATMGRLMQFIAEERVKLTSLYFLVLDEADKLLKDEIFYKDIMRIQEMAAKNEHRHRTLMFSATFDEMVEEFAGKLLRPNYFMVAVGGSEMLPPTVRQKFVEATKYQKFSILCDEVLAKLRPKEKAIYRDANGITWRRLKKKVVIFCNSRRMTNWLALKLSIRGWKSIPTSGERSQMQRQEALDSFEKGDCDVLVSTSVIARGLNFVGLKLVINYEMPKTFDDFVHRTGRTGRAGHPGRAITFIDPDCLLDLRLVPHLIREMKRERMEVPAVLSQLAVTLLEEEEEESEKC